MPRPPSRTVFVVVPGASQSPSHYGYLLHILHSRGYPTLSALLPSTGPAIGSNVTAQDDTDYVRERMLLPILDTEEHDVIMVMHSYGGLPGSAAALGLGKADRAAQGKSTSVLGQIFISALLIKGGDGNDVITNIGGQIPPHMGVDKAPFVLTCDDPGPPLYQDVEPKELQDVIVMSTLCPSWASWHSPCPRASFDSEGFKDRIAFIRTVKDQCAPYDLQTMMIQGTGVEWTIRDIDTGHSPNLTAPEKLCDMLVDLAKQFEKL